MERLHGWPGTGPCVSSHSRTQPLLSRKHDPNNNVEKTVTKFLKNATVPPTTMYILLEVFGFDPRTTYDSNGNPGHFKPDWDRTTVNAYNILNRTLQRMEEEGLITRSRHGRTNFWSWNHNGQGQMRKLFVKGLVEPISERDALALIAEIVDALQYVETARSIA